MEKPFRVAVTGSRGKSGVVRLIHAAFCACGLKTYSRITGVVPRELRKDGERPIMRLSGANVSEMKWWLSTLPHDTDGVVLENSAVTPDLQGLCALWLKPQVIVLTNIRPDHEAYWGRGEENVLRALSHALPHGSSIVLPEKLAANPAMQLLTEKKQLKLLPAREINGLPPHLSANTGLALEVCRFFGLDESKCMSAMKELPADFADFTILNIGNGRLAFAFSANDVTTTEGLFQSTGWSRKETCVLFNHRADRVDRFRSFEGWMSGYPWHDVLIIGDAPPRTKIKCTYFPCNNIDQLAEKLSSGYWFGCGNTVYGLTLPLKLACEEGRIQK